MDFPTRFDHKESEARLYETWEKRGHFTANPASGKKPHVIVIPPPNVTGSLHMGHALNNTLQDILTRWKRMAGYEALFLPGTDHAGIATQVKVEKELAKEKKTRFQLGREAFLQRVWEWKEKYGNTILYQLRRLGCSCDWSRTRFTMDADYSRAVRTVFAALYKKGLIYRGQYIVNWCPRCLTALSDIEVVQKQEAGKLWHIRYPIKGEKKHITVATTRPETMLGDVAVAVNPKDERYQSLIGKAAVLPFMNREIKIIADAFVDPAFGTGAVKITPAHDLNDFEASRRHQLTPIVIMDEKAVMNEHAGPFKGLDRFKAREKIVEQLTQLGLLEKEEAYPVPLGRCDRCQTPVEPYLSEQWFVKMKPLAEPAIAAVREGTVRFTPERWAKLYLDWLENTRDWCISRQIWWGHRIPVWNCGCGTVTASVDDLKSCPKCGSVSIEQDPDVLDTWFSSALWPFATLGWPAETADLERFYPTHTLVTARDIIYLWVARMVIMGQEFMGANPFSDVVINPTIQNPEGKRMSKSLGTGVDPLELIDQFGADATRLGLAIQVTDAQDIRYSPAKMEQSRNFVTKLWNASRFVTQNLKRMNFQRPNPAQLDFEDRWILSRMESTVSDVQRALESFQFGTMSQTLVKFVWNDLCDWYIEWAKKKMDRDATQAVLFHCLTTTLNVMHPVIPFVTEEIWQRLRALGADLPEMLITTSWPKPVSEWIDSSIESDMEIVMESIRGIRDVRNRMNISRAAPLSVVLDAKTPAVETLFQQRGELIRSMAAVDVIQVGRGLAKPPLSATVVGNGYTMYIPLAGKIDRDAELKKQKDRKAKVEAQAAQARAKVTNEQFKQNAPEEIFEQESQRLSDLEQQLKELTQAISEIESWAT